MLAATSIVIPTFHEAKNLPGLMEKLAQLNKFFATYEVIIVDDNSQDNSEAILESLKQKYPWLNYIIRHAKTPDLSQSVVLGLQQARYEVLAVMDADLSHDPAELGKLVAALQNSAADFAIGSRFIKQSKIDEDWPLFRRWNAWVAKALTKKLVRLHDPLSGFFCLHKDTFQQAGPLRPIGYKIALELMIKCHCRQIIEVPIHFHQRQFGNSKLNLRQQLKYLRHLLRLYRYQQASKHERLHTQ